jgi:hypothetical protein
MCNTCTATTTVVNHEIEKEKAREGTKSSVPYLHISTVLTTTIMHYAAPTQPRAVEIPRTSTALSSQQVNVPDTQLSCIHYELVRHKKLSKLKHAVKARKAVCSHPSGTSIHYQTQCRCPAEAGNLPGGKRERDMARQKQSLPSLTYSSMLLCSTI